MIHLRGDMSLQDGFTTFHTIWSGWQISLRISSETILYIGRGGSFGMEIWKYTIHVTCIGYFSMRTWQHKFNKEGSVEKVWVSVARSRIMTLKWQLGVAYHSLVTKNNFYLKVIVMHYDFIWLRWYFAPQLKNRQTSIASIYWKLFSSKRSSVKLFTPPVCFASA